MNELLAKLGSDIVLMLSRKKLFALQTVQPRHQLKNFVVTKAVIEILFDFCEQFVKLSLGPHTKCIKRFCVVGVIIVIFFSTRPSPALLLVLGPLGKT